MTDGDLSNCIELMEFFALYSLYWYMDSSSDQSSLPSYTFFHLFQMLWIQIGKIQSTSSCKDLMQPSYSHLPGLVITDKSNY